MVATFVPGLVRTEMATVDGGNEAKAVRELPTDGGDIHRRRWIPFALTRFPGSISV